MSANSEMLTAKKFAERAGVSYTTVMAWLRDGLIPNAVLKEEVLGTFWQIPASSLNKVNKPRRGRPKKASDESSTALPEIASVTKAVAGVITKKETESQSKKKKKA